MSKSPWFLRTSFWASPVEGDHFCSSGAGNCSSFLDMTGHRVSSPEEGDHFRSRRPLIGLSWLVVDFAKSGGLEARVNNKSQLSGTTRPDKPKAKRLNQTF